MPHYGTGQRPDCEAGGSPEKNTRGAAERPEKKQRAGSAAGGACRRPARRRRTKGGRPNGAQSRDDRPRRSLTGAPEARIRRREAGRAQPARRHAGDRRKTREPRRGENRGAPKEGGSAWDGRPPYGEATQTARIAAHAGTRLTHGSGLTTEQWTYGENWTATRVTHGNRQTTEQ